MVFNNPNQNPNPNPHHVTEPQETMTIVTTRSGEEEFKPVLTAGMRILRKLYMQSEPAVRDLYGLAKSMEYEADGENARKLYEAGFLDETGYMHPSSRRLALSAITLDANGKVRIVDPIAPVGVVEGKVVSQERHVGTV